MKKPSAPSLNIMSTVVMSAFNQVSHGILIAFCGNVESSFVSVFGNRCDQKDAIKNKHKIKKSDCWFVNEIPKMCIYIMYIFAINLPMPDNSRVATILDVEVTVKINI